MITVIANLKGGSGKSTVAFNLAVWLEKNRREVVGYDLDPQCTFSDLAMLRKETGTTPDLTIHSRPSAVVFLKEWGDIDFRNHLSPSTEFDPPLRMDLRCARSLRSGAIVAP